MNIESIYDMVIRFLILQQHIKNLQREIIILYKLLLGLEFV